MRNADNRLLLLGLLRIQKMHGYQLQQFLDEHMEFLSPLKASTAYYTLEKMAQEGLVEATREREGNRPVRQVYCLTAAGEARFRQLLEENLSFYDSEQSGGDVGIAFLEALTREEAARLLSSKREHVRSRIAEVKALLARIRTAKPLHLSLVHARLRLEADLEWIKEVETSCGIAISPRMLGLDESSGAGG